MTEELDMINSLTLQQQKYIETIYDLCKLQGDAHSKDIAEILEVKMPTVTFTLRNLSNLGIINYKARQAITLTVLGNNIAEILDVRHKNLSVFFNDILGCEESRAESFACEIEHVIDCELSNRLKAFSSFIKEYDDQYNIANKFKEYYSNLGN
jgi:DtxR family Mn-dependent transcriptional regulator